MTKDTKTTWRKSLNLPATTFSMRANLAQNEPDSVKRWEGMRLYDLVTDAREGCEPFTFHDGPPFANGDIHVGHMLNKVLKDFIVRSKTLAGYDVPYVPGWDCHGLPIEHQVMQQLGNKAINMSATAIRRGRQRSAERQARQAIRRARREHPDAEQQDRADETPSEPDVAEPVAAIRTKAPRLPRPGLAVASAPQVRGEAKATTKGKRTAFTLQRT